MTLTALELVHAGTYPWNPAPSLTVTAYGLPAAQGSKAYKGHRTSKTTGRKVAVLVEQSKRVKPWRAVVTAAAKKAIAVGPLAGPIRVDVIFTMKKPGNAPKRTRTYPAVSPDQDKVLRSTFDALTEARAWEDDGRVIEIHAVQCYPGEHPDALDQPGAIIRLYTLGAPQ